MQPQFSLIRLFLTALFFVYGGIALMEYWSHLVKADMLAGHFDPNIIAWKLKFILPYQAKRAEFMVRWWINIPLLVLAPIAIFLSFRWISSKLSRLHEQILGMRFKQEAYNLKNPLLRWAKSNKDAIDKMQHAWLSAYQNLEKPEEEVLLGIDSKKQPVVLNDNQRSMHMQVLGYTGSGKTQSVLFPLMLQDALRPWHNPIAQKPYRRAIALLDAKGSIENEDMLASIAKASGRLDKLKIFSLNPNIQSHTYNPLYISADSDPKQVAERVFSTFEFDVQYYRDVARELWINLICAFASTGKQMTMLDVAAAISNTDVMRHGLSLAKDLAAVNAIRTRYKQLGEKAHETYMGLLTQVRAYHHPALNVYNPDIIMEDVFNKGEMIGFSLNSNAYKVQARAIGLIAMQDIQQVGAGRQLNRNKIQAPAYVYADEFYNFAYEGFTDAVNKLRDANISMALFHQSMSDLNKVSPEFAQGVWDSTRNKIILYQSDAILCENLAASVGTRKQVVQTLRRGSDGFLNQKPMLEASTREVDEFVLHPNNLKHLKMGQAYLVQSGLAENEYRGWQFWRKQKTDSPTVAKGVNLSLMPDLPKGKRPQPNPRDTTSGLGLANMVLELKYPSNMTEGFVEAGQFQSTDR